MIRIFSVIKNWIDFFFKSDSETVTCDREDITCDID